MYFCRVRTEFTDFTRNPVVPACAYRHDKITVNNRFISVSSAVHSKHAYREGMFF